LSRLVVPQVSFQHGNWFSVHVGREEGKRRKKWNGEVALKGGGEDIIAVLVSFKIACFYSFSGGGGKKGKRERKGEGGGRGRATVSPRYGPCLNSLLCKVPHFFKQRRGRGGEKKEGGEGGREGPQEFLLFGSAIWAASLLRGGKGEWGRGGEKKRKCGRGGVREHRT